MKNLKFSLFLVVSLFTFSCFCQFNRCQITVEGKVGYIDTNGVVIITPQFQGGSQFSEGVASVMKDGKWGCIDSVGTFIIEPKYDHAERFIDGCASVGIDDKWGLINLDDELLLDIEYDFIYYRNDSLVGVSKNDLWAFYDITKRKFITDFMFAEIGSFNDGVAMIGYSGLYGFIDKNGKIVIELIYDQVQSFQFSSGLAAVRKKGTKWGFVNTKGEVVIDFIYDNVSNFKEGKALVYTDYWLEKKKKGFFIDVKGNRLFKETFEDSWGFVNGLCAVTKNGKDGVIDSKGRWIVKPKYDDISGYYYHDWIFFVQEKDGKRKYGLLNRNGKELIEARYHRVVKNDGDCILPEVYEGDCKFSIVNCSKGYVNMKGEVIWQPTK